MTIPVVIFSDQRTRTRSLRTRFGHDGNWSYYVKDYVEAMVSDWTTLDDAEKWVFESDFVDTMNKVWAITLRHNLM